MKDNPTQKCIICGEYAPKGILCKECYGIMDEFKSDFYDEDFELSEINDYYENIKNKAYRTNDEFYIVQHCQKLIALANLAYDYFDKSALLSKVKEDVSDIVNKKLKSVDDDIEINISKGNYQETNIQITSTIQEKSLLRTIDGHKVKSRGEKIIDDILFSNRIPHAYSMTVAEIDTKIDRSIECDWFIPIIGSGKGIYIEYWGMDTKDYNDNKKEKTKLYEKYELPLIQIEKDEIDDSQALNIRIRREINSLAKEKYKTIVDF